MPPAARLGDHHICTHVGGAISSRGEPTVLIGGRPAARVGDKCACGSPLDTITMGEPTVLIGGPMAARMGDPTAHSGVITSGDPTVLIGTSPCVECLREAARQRAVFVKGAVDRRPPGAMAQAKALRAAGGAASGAGRAGGAEGPRAIDVDAAVSHLDASALPASNKECARYTRRAIEAGGVTLQRTRYAKDYGPSLERAGFRAVADPVSYWRYEPQRGDVVVYQNPPGRTEGHMAMYNGTQWVSDFRQPRMQPGGSYRDVPFTVYRP